LCTLNILPGLFITDFLPSLVSLVNIIYTGIFAPPYECVEVILTLIEHWQHRSVILGC